MCTRYTLVNILAAASVRGERVPDHRTRAVKATRGVVASIGADVSTGGQSTFINVLTGDPIHITELITSSTVTLIGSINVCTLLTARVCLAFVYVIAVSPIAGQFEASCTAALVGPQNILTLVSTQAARIMPAFIDVFTTSGDAVKHETSPAFTAVRAHQINATMIVAGIIRPGTLIRIYAASSFGVQMVPATAVNNVSLACV